MASAPLLTLGALAVVLMAAGASLLWYRRKVRLQQRLNSWRELCLRLELSPQPGDARVATGEFQQGLFLLHDTGSQWLVELPLAQPLLPPGMILLSPNAPTLPPPIKMRPLAWEPASSPAGMQAWIVEGAELSGKVEAPQAFLDEATRAMQAHAPLRVEPQRFIQALRAGSLLSVNEAREAVRALAATARRWLEVAEHSGLPRVQPLPQPQALPASQEVQTPPPTSHVLPPFKRKRKHKRKKEQRASPHELVVDFNVLPRLTRERFVTATGPSPEVVPIMADQSFRGGCLWTWGLAGVGALSLLCLYKLATLPGFGVNHPKELILFYAPALFCALAAALVLLFQGKWRRTLPFHPGRYVFPLDFVDATTRQLRIIPLRMLADFRWVAHHSYPRNSKPVYSHTVVTLQFHDKQGDEEFVIHDRDLMDAQFSRLRQVHTALVSGNAPTDEAILRKIDPFFEARHQPGGLEALRGKAPETDSGEGPLAHELPRRLQPSFLLGLTVLVSLLLGPSLWLVRNRIHDEAAFAEAKQYNTGSVFKNYADSQGRHAAEARALGTQLTFQTCEKEDTEQCWGGFLSLWPDAPQSEEVRRERQPRAALKTTPRTVAGLKKFLKNYPHSVVAAEVRERLLPAAELQELPANNVTALRQFRRQALRPWVDAQAQARIQELYAAAQAEFQSQASPYNPQAVLFMSQVLTFLESSESSLVHVRFRRQVAPPLSGPWGAVSTERLEGQTVKALGNAFQQLFAEGVLTLVHGESLPEQPEATDLVRPRIDIRYTISRSGVSSSGGRQFPGVQFDFDVALRRPGAQPVRISLQVKPPKDFQFDASGPAPSDSAASSIMAQRAFAELSGRLSTVFFRPDSKVLQPHQHRVP